jgi:hypothetical protein
MTDVLTTTPAQENEWVDPGCGCCKPPAPPTVEDRVQELQARREELQRRLATVQAGPR